MVPFLRLSTRLTITVRAVIKAGYADNPKIDAATELFASVGASSAQKHPALKQREKGNMRLQFWLSR